MTRWARRLALTLAITAVLVAGPLKAGHTSVAVLWSMAGFGIAYGLARWALTTARAGPAVAEIRQPGMDKLAEQDQITLFVMAVVEQTTVAEQQRRAVTAYTARALSEPGIAVAVDAILAARAARQDRGNVTGLAGRRRRGQ